MNNEEKKSHIVTDNVAIPEIRFDENQTENDEKEKEGSIDFDTAIPEIHIRNDKDD